jgi:hypothetical protein
MDLLPHMRPRKGVCAREEPTLVGGLCGVGTRCLRPCRECAADAGGAARHEGDYQHASRGAFTHLRASLPDDDSVAHRNAVVHVNTDADGVAYDHRDADGLAYDHRDAEPDPFCDAHGQPHADTRADPRWGGA